MRKILLIGKNGQIGWELLRTLAPLGAITTPNRREMDLTKPDSIRQAVNSLQPDLIVNAAAYTAVDKAESDKDLAMTVNGVAPGILAEEAKRLNATLIHFSTDYVFDGTKPDPYCEDDEPNPVNVYGKTKLEGDRAIIAAGGAHFIFRTSWVYGARGTNFLLTMLRLAKERDQLRVVSDQIGSPTWSRLIAEAVAQILGKHYGALSASNGLSGIYHLSAAGKTSWHGFAKDIFQHDLVKSNNLTFGLPRTGPRISPISSAAYAATATRPANSILDCTKVTKTFDVFLPDWRESLSLCLADLTVR